MSKNIAILGAFDRFNYGDLILPIIIEKVLNKYNIDCIIDFYGLIDSDLGQYGGKVTKSIKSLFDKDTMRINDSILILAGGEILSATWFDMYATLLPRKIAVSLVIFQKIIGEKLISRISRVIIGSNLLLPWIISPSDFNSSVKILYNTAGGSSISRLSPSYKKDINEKLSLVNFLSVRDHETKNFLQKIQNNNVDIAPDSAILMSEFFPVSELESKVCSETRKIIEQFPDGYICFQSNRYIRKNDEYIITSELQKIYEEFGYGVVLIPFSNATFHEDEVALNKIHSNLTIPSVMTRQHQIYDIMALIAKSQTFVGTSLHGCITAQSFCVPHIGLGKKGSKLDVYLETWGLPEQANCVSCDQIFQSMKSIISIQYEMLKKKRCELIFLSYKNFEKMLIKADLYSESLPSQLKNQKPIYVHPNKEDY